jgi:hypothetical protein
MGAAAPGAGAAPAPRTALAGRAAPAAPSADDPGCQASDYRLQESANLSVYPPPGPTSDDLVQLWYSPSTRCVYGKLALFIPCQTEICNVRVITHFPSGKNTYTAPCNVPVGQSVCYTDKVNDANVQSSAEGVRVFSTPPAWLGKTQWW